MLKQTCVALCVLAVGASDAAAAAKVKVGLVLTLSGSAAVLGQQARNGFQLALKDLGGKFGGVPADVTIIDDEQKPDVAVSRVKGLLGGGDVDFVVGPIFSNVLQAIFKPVTDSKAFLIGPNAGPSIYAGRGCSPNFFVTSYENDQTFEVPGKVAQERRYKSVYLLVPNYQGGKDAILGFKSQYKGRIAGETYVPLGTLDFQSELAAIAAAKPDALFAFMPGGLGVNLVRQFRQAGLADSIVFLSTATVDESTLPAQRDAALGFFGGTDWAPTLDTPQNKRFVAEYEATYGAVPATYAFQAYDAALLIDGAVRDVKGDLSNKDAVRAALRKADFKSLRGDFTFNTNGYPIQNFYLTRVEKRPDGKFQTAIVEKVLSADKDPYAKDCAVKP